MPIFTWSGIDKSFFAGDIAHAALPTDVLHDVPMETAESNGVGTRLVSRSTAMILRLDLGDLDVLDPVVEFDRVRAIIAFVFRVFRGRFPSREELRSRSGKPSKRR